MEIVTLRAHFDGKQILLDEPFELEASMELTVTVKRGTLDDERSDWGQLSLRALERAYRDDEPDYPLELIKEANPEYEGR